MLTGWGRTAPSGAEVLRPRSIARAVRSAGPRGILARGLGRSYGDAAQNAGGTVVELLDTVDIGPTDTGEVRCSAGTSLDALLRRVVPRGWFVPVTPGTRFVTLGGALAADVHGKNHHHAGSLAGHVTSLQLVDGTGTVRDLTPVDEEFWAVAGGMGLTGVITELTLRLLPIRSATMHVRTERTADLDETMRVLAVAEERTYSVGWVDTLSASGRGIVTSAEHAETGPLAFAPRTRLTTPPWAPPRLLNRHSVAAFNAGYYAAGRSRESRQSAAAYFYPLDAVSGWNRLYGRAGLIQYQFVVADPDVVGWTLSQLRAAGVPSLLTVLKRLGAANPAPLSFPMPGWTLALDLPAAVPGLGRVLDRIDERVAATGGRVYLAKDSRLRPQLLPTMYPGLDRWRELRARLDPHRVFASDLSRRLLL